jgi:hypothetical protein
VQEWGEDEEDEESAVIEGKDAQGAASVELGEKARVGTCIEQDAGDEESGEDEEEVDAEEPEVEGVAEKPSDAASGGEVAKKGVVEEHHEDGHAADAIERVEMATARMSRGWSFGGGDHGFPETALLFMGRRRSGGLGTIDHTCRRMFNI